MINFHLLLNNSRTFLNSILNQHFEQECFCNVFPEKTNFYIFSNLPNQYLPVNCHLNEEDKT